MKTPFRFFRTTPSRHPMGTWLGTLCLLVGLGASACLGQVTLVKDINTFSDFFPGELTAVGSTLYFAANNGPTGSELWKSDGTAAGTVLVKDINPGSGNSALTNLTVFGGTLYFSATDPTAGQELWKTDGTEAGTVRVKDLNPTGDSNPGDLTVVGGTLYFRAEDGITGVELWKLDAVQPCDPRVALYPATPGRACQGDSLAVTFSTVGDCPSPAPGTFTVQLSSPTGSFANPIVLGFAAPGTTNLALPPSLPLGTGYRVRILSGNPAQDASASLPFRIVGPSLAVTPGVAGAPVCRGQAVTVSFTLPDGSCAFPGENGFTAQLSNASGSFTNPVSLGAVQAGVSNSVTIPANTPAGTGYRIRVVSSSPVLTSSASAPLRVNANCVSRLSAEEAELVVLPNPVSGREVRVRVSGMDDPAFSLTTSVGRGVGITANTDGSGEFVLTPKQPLPVGVYVLHASEGATRLTRRILVVE